MIYNWRRRCLLSLSVVSVVLIVTVLNCTTVKKLLNKYQGRGLVDGRSMVAASAYKNRDVIVSVRHAALYREVCQIVEHVDDIEELLSMYRECAAMTGLFKQLAARHQTDVAYYYGSMEIVYRLSDLRNSGGIDGLLELLQDNDLVFDGEMALLLGNAISRCGMRAIPQLKLVKGEKAVFAREIIECIERGDEFGP